MPKSLTYPRLMVEGQGNCSNLLYASGFHPVDPVVFLDEGRRGRSLVVPMLEYGRAQLETRSVRVLLPDSIGVAPGDQRSLAKTAAALLASRRVKRIQVDALFPIQVARELEKSGISIHVSEGPLYPERIVKKPHEVSAITASQKAAVAAMRAARDILRASAVSRGGLLKHDGKTLTSESVRGVIDTTLLKKGCFARDTIVAGGAQGADPHDHGSGPLRAGEAIVIDIFPQDRVTGYWGDITRTFCKGEPGPELARMYRAVRQAQAMALAMIRPGVPACDVHSMIREYFDRNGFPTYVKDGVVRGFFHGTGHGVGLDIHEQPSLGLAKTPLKSGHVVTVEPGLYDPDIGGVRIEDTVVVKRDGAHILASFPKTFTV